MDFWEFEIDAMELFILIGILTCVFLVSNTIRRKVPLIAKSLIPTAVIGGILVLVLKELGLFDKIVNVDNINRYMEAITYHTLGMGFVALSLKSTDKIRNRKKQKDILNSGLITVTSYAIQGIVGVGITILLAVTFLPDLFPASGLLLPMGFGQGSGQALNFGQIFQEEWGFQGGVSFGLSIAAIGFLVACIFGVLHIAIMRKKGFTLKDSNTEFVSEEIIASPNEVPVTESVDRLSIQVGLILFVYFITFLFMFAVEQIQISSVQKFLDNTVKPMIWGFNFLLGSIFAVLLKIVFKYLKKYNIMNRDYPNNYLLNRISGFMFDVMIIAGIGAININVLKGLLLPLISICIVGLVVTYFYVRKCCYILFPDYKDESFLSLFGMLTGTASTGMIVLREVDPKFETPAAMNLVYLTFYAIAFGFPFFLLMGYAPQGLTQSIITFIILLVVFIVYNVILFRSRIFKKKNRE